MNNPPNKSHAPWTSQNGWPTPTQESLYNTLTSSQHLSMGSSPAQRMSYQGLQTPSQSCVIGPATSSPTHHSSLFRNSHSNAVTPGFANPAIQRSCRGISFDQENSQKNHVTQSCEARQLPLLSPHVPYKPMHHQLLPGQASPNSLEDVPLSLPSCGRRRVNANRSPSEGLNMEFAQPRENIHRHSSTTQTQCQWVPPTACRENECVPEQEGGNNIPLASDETRRSDLLLQRAQLLQRLGELDKCCGSSTDTSSQNQQNKTRTEQPSTGKTKRSYVEHLTEAESEIMGNSSVGSGDSDPAHPPGRDNDSSEDSSESEGISSGESRPSSPSACTEKKSSFPVRKKAKLEISQVGIRPPLRPTNLRKASNTPVSCTNSKGRRGNEKLNYCLFCSKPQTKVSRHLSRIHSDKKEVAAALRHPQNDPERRRIFNRLINEGNFAHNKVVLKTGEGQIAVKKRPRHPRKAGEFLNCLYCKALFLRKSLFKHMKTCPDQKKNERHFGRQILASRCVLEASEDLGVTEEFKNVLANMIYDHVTQTVLDDELLLQYGELTMEQNRENPKMQHYVRQNLRQIARLLIEAQKTTPIKKLVDVFDPSNFPHVLSAVNILAGYNAENNSYRVASLPVKVGGQLQNICTIVEANAVNSGDETLAEYAQNFLSEYQKHWNKLVSVGSQTIKKNILKTRKNAPRPQDVRRLNTHMEKLHHLAEKNLRDAPSIENYAVLVKLLLTRTLFLNRRRAAEVMSLSLKDFAARKKSDVVRDMDPSVSDLERSMCGCLVRIDIQGRCGILPVFLKPSFISAMEVVIEVRKVCCIPTQNPFLFARPTALTPYNAALCVKQIATECGAENPSFLTIRKLRRHYTTMMQLISLDEKEAEQILGSSNLVRTLREDSSAYLDDLHMRLEARLRFERRRASLHAGKHFRLAEFYEEHVDAAKSGTFKSTTAFRQLHVNKWDETEVRAIERHMMDFIKKQKVPQKNDCVKCLEAENEALRDRSWKGVKNYVRNRITTLQNAKKASKTVTRRCINEDGHGSDGGSNDKRSQHQDSAQLDDNEAARNSHKHKWGEAEVRAVEKHLIHFVEGQVIPQKIDCVRCLDAEPVALRNRSWKGVKDYIRNRITAVQSGRKGEAKDPAASTPAKAMKQRAAPKQRKGGVNEAVPYNNAQIAQQYGTQINTHGDAGRQQAASWSQSEHLGVPQGSTEVHTEQSCQPSSKAKGAIASKSTVSSKKVVRSGGKNKWGEEEVRAVERQMMSFIQGHKIPQKNDCIRCLDTEVEALRNRSWKGLKDYVRNRITAHIRQGGTSQMTPLHSNWTRGEEQQQHYQPYWTN